MSDITVLLATRDDELLEDVLRLAAAAGVILDVAHDTPSASRGWSQASMVLVGADQLHDLAGRSPVRRSQVHVVGRSPVADELLRDALRIGAENVVELPKGETWLVELLTDVADGRSNAALTVAVVAGSGGAGGTTFAAALARSAATDDRRVLLLDADPLGSGVVRVLGFDELDGVGWEALLESSGRFSSRSLRDSLPQRDGLAVLTWNGVGPRPALDTFTAREALSAAQRGNDLVVIDLPRYPSGVAAELLPRCDQLILVCGLTVPAAVAASRVAAYLTEVGRPVSLVTRGRATAVAPEEIASTLNLPLMASMADQRRLLEAIELGLGPVHPSRGPLARAARKVLQQLDAPAARAA